MTLMEEKKASLRERDCSPTSGNENYSLESLALVRALHCSALDRQEWLGALVEVNLTELRDEYIKHDVASMAFTLQESLI